MSEMTSRERILAAVNHQEPDRVPLDIGGSLNSSILVEGYKKLEQHLGMSGETKLLSKLGRIVQMDESVLQRLGSDCRPLMLKPSSRWEPPPSAPGTFTDIWGVTWKQAYYAQDCFYWELAHSPLAEASVDDLESYQWPDPMDPGFTAGLADEAKALYEETDYAIVAESGFKNFWEQAYMLRGLEQMLMDLVLNPDFVSALMAKLLKINSIVTGRYLDAVGSYIHVFRAGDDLATQKGLLMSPKTYRTLLKPVYKAFYDLIKSKTEAKLFYHSCGNVVELIDDLVDVGVEIINPVQVSAMGDTAALKDRYGDKVAFWGGIDTQHVLPHGSIKEVEAEVQQRIRDLGPGGGYVLAAVHNIQPDVPPQNILRMAEATREFGTYPLAA